MNTTTISDGEVADFRTRIAGVEVRSNTNERRMDVHEEKCAGRYRAILFLLLLSMAMNAPTAWPHIATLIGLMK